MVLLVAGGGVVVTDFTGIGVDLDPGVFIELFVGVGGRGIVVTADDCDCDGFDIADVGVDSDVKKF